MESVGQRADDGKCVCAICNSSFGISEDNLFRRLKLYEFVRVLETGVTPRWIQDTSFTSAKRDEVYLQMELELKQREHVSLCDQCVSKVITVLGTNELARENEAAVDRIQLYLNNDLVSLQCRHKELAELFQGLRRTDEEILETPADADQDPTVIAGLKSFRKLLSARANEIKNYHVAVEQFQSDLQNQVTPMDVDDPMQGPSNRLLALPDSVAFGQQGSNQTWTKPKDQSTRPKLIRPRRMREFAAGIIERALRSAPQPAYKTSEKLRYDEQRKQLSFGKVNIEICEETRCLKCGKCGAQISPPKLKPGGFFHVELQMKKHVILFHPNACSGNDDSSTETSADNQAGDAESGQDATLPKGNFSEDSDGYVD